MSDGGVEPRTSPAAYNSGGLASPIDVATNRYIKGKSILRHDCRQSSVDRLQLKS